MRILKDTIFFQSAEPYYTKEKNGLKPNTVRSLSNMELLDFLQEKEKGNIRKINIALKHDPRNYFERELTDITEWQGLLIFSWRHENEHTE